MAVTSNIFRGAKVKWYNKLTDWANDDIRVALLTSTASPNLDTWLAYSDLTNEVAAGGGYSTGGFALSGKGTSYTAADSWGTSRANSTAYTVGQVYRPASANGHLYQCIVAGTSAGSPPTFPTVAGTDYADGTATFQEVALGIVQVTASNLSQASTTITARYAVVYNNTPGTSSTKWLIALQNFGADVVSSNGNYNINWDSLGVFHDFVR